MKELIVFLSIFFSFGIEGQCDKRQEILIVRELAERSLYMAKERDYDGIQQFFKLMSNDSFCGVKVADGDFSYYTKEAKKIIQPLNDWIVQTSKKVRILDTYLKQAGINIENIYETDFDFDNKLIDTFLGECNVPFYAEKHKRSINTNDIYQYQNLMNTEKEGTKDFQCGAGGSIDFNRTCDGNMDCWDGSDELGACEETAGCEQCSGSCVTGPRGPECVASCPAGFGPPVKFCSSSGQCYSVCVRRGRRKVISLECLQQIFPNLFNTTNEKYRRLMNALYNSYMAMILSRCRDGLYESGHANSNDKDDSMEGLYTTFPPTTRHPTWHPTTRHSTWHPTTRHPTWHTTTRHPTWHPTTRHPTWHPTSRHTTWHPTWHPTTRHPTWHTTTRHPTWHPTTRHPTWHPTTRHPTWHTTTRHPTWHPTTRHPTWHPTSRHTTWHPTWHPTTRHPTWHTTTRPTTWDPVATESIWDSNESDNFTQFDENKHHTTKHHTTKHTTHHTTKHHTTKHTTKHTTHHTTRHTTTPPTTTTTPTKSTTSPTTTTTSSNRLYGNVIYIV